MLIVLVNATGVPSSSNLMQSAPRPRLVAKTASGHRALAPKSIDITSKFGKGSGPDPNQVWNRNRGERENYCSY